MAEIYTVKTRGIGLPDYAQAKPVGSVPVGPVYTSTDIAELAARLGSIVTFDRRGNVTFLDDFEGTLGKWDFLTGIEGFRAEISPDFTRSGSFSAKLTTGANRKQLMYCYRPFPVLSKQGFEFSFAYSDMEEIQMDMQINKGDYVHFASAKWIRAEKKCQYCDDGEIYRDLSPLVRPKSSSFAGATGRAVFNTIKLVVDSVTDEYVRLILNDTIYDLSGLRLFNWVAAGDAIDATWMAPMIWFTSTVVSQVIYIDDVILTQNEPANPVE